jgi:hypothetical protein
MDDGKGIVDKFQVRSFSLHQSACNGSEASQPPIQLVVSFTGGKQLGCEADHSCLSRVKIKNK